MPSQKNRWCRFGMHASYMQSRAAKAGGLIMESAYIFFRPEVGADNSFHNLSEHTIERDPRLRTQDPDPLPQHILFLTCPKPFLASKCSNCGDSCLCRLCLSTDNVASYRTQLAQRPLLTQSLTTAVCTILPPQQPSAKSCIGPIHCRWCPGTASIRTKSWAPWFHADRADGYLRWRWVWTRTLYFYFPVKIKSHTMSK